MLWILSASDQESVQVVGGDRRIRTSSGYAAFEMGTVLIVGISEPGRGDGDGSRFAVFIHLNQHSGNRLPAPFGHNGAVVAVELQGRSLYHIGLLPDPGIPGIDGRGGGAVRRHVLSSYVNRGR